jgi:hypothetical protein
MKMMKTFLPISIVFLLVFVSCRNETKKIIPTKFERTWYSIDGNLKIDSLNTFEYVRFTCVSRSISKGKWRILNDTLILNSNPPHGCYFEEEFEIKQPKDTINFTPLKITEKDCAPNRGYVNFKNEKFYIKDSLLMSKKSAYYSNGEYNHHTNFREKSYYQE